MFQQHYSYILHLVLVNWLWNILKYILFLFFLAVLKDPDRNPYSILDTSESDQTADAEASECEPSSRSRRSRRRRPESEDNTSLSENGLGKYTSHTQLLGFIHNFLLILLPHCRLVTWLIGSMLKTKSFRSESEKFTVVFYTGILKVV